MEFKPLTETCATCGKKKLPSGLSAIFENICVCSSSDDDEPNIVISEHYRVLQKLGKGSLTVAYKASSGDVDRFFVIKVLREEYAKNPRTAKRFKIESERACNLNHPNLSAIYEVGTTEDGLPYIGTDYLEGQSVEEYLNKEGFFEESETMLIFRSHMRLLQIFQMLISRRRT